MLFCFFWNGNKLVKSLMRVRTTNTVISVISLPHCKVQIKVNISVIRGYLLVYPSNSHLISRKQNSAFPKWMSNQFCDSVRTF